MRTAITLAKTHDGKWELLATPDDSLVEQRTTFKGMRGARSDKKYSTVIYQESDGHHETIRMMTPEQHKKHDDQHEKDVAEAKKNSDESKAAADSNAKTKERTESDAAFAKATEAALKEEAAAKKAAAKK